MNRAAARACWALAVLALGACSRHEAAPEGRAPQPSTTFAASAAREPAASPSADPLVTPEDAEEDAAQRITEQNLESELDRLEREIQAE